MDAMEIRKKYELLVINNKLSLYFRISARYDDDDVEVGHMYLYLLFNDLHKQPFGFIEDVFVEESYRGRGIGESLMQTAITAAKNAKCYKLIATTRHEKEKVRDWYLGMGFRNHGVELRMDFQEQGSEEK